MPTQPERSDVQLPEPAFTSYQTDSTMRTTELLSYSDEQMRTIYQQGFEEGLAVGSAKRTKSAKPKAGQPDKPADVSDQVWTDFLRLRKEKKAPLTATALALIVKAAASANYTLEAALQMCCERGWQAFRADWVGPARGTPGNLSNRNYGNRGFDGNGHLN